MDRRHFLTTSAGSLLSTVPGALLQAQTSPAASALPGTAFIVSGFPAGGMGDLVSRPLADQLRGRYAETLAVDNRPGAGGRIAVEYVKRAPADGKTILQIPGSVMALYPNLYPKLAYDPQNDFAPVSPLCTYMYTFTAGPGLPAEIRTVADFVKWARANPKQSVYGIPAAGSPLHFAGMLLKQAADIEFASVPYRGGAPLLQDLLGGQVPVSFNVMGEVLPGIRSGKLRALGVTSAKRSAFLPDTPTLVEQGYPNIALQEWLGWFLHAQTPPDTVRRLAGMVRETLQTREMKEQLARNALEPLLQTPSEFAATLRRDTVQWAPLVKATGFKAEE